MKTVYLIVGVPGSGKSTVCRALGQKFNHVPHDDHHESVYPVALLEAAGERPALGEIPFGLSKIQERLERFQARVVPVFILEDERTLKTRYEDREGHVIPKGHLTRQHTYRQRAQELGAFAGTAEEVLQYLQGVAA